MVSLSEFNYSKLALWQVLCKKYKTMTKSRDIYKGMSLYGHFCHIELLILLRQCIYHVTKPCFDVVCRLFGYVSIVNVTQP